MIQHITAAREGSFPEAFLRFCLAGSAIGYVTPDFAEALVALGCDRDGPAIVLRDPAKLNALVRTLADAGALRLRDELFDVRARPGGPVLARIDRGALPRFGIAAEGVHVNGLVRRAGGIFLWVGRRSMAKALDPGKLDHIVAGGIAAGMDARETLIKEAAEEAGLPASLARHARPVATVAYAMVRAEGLRRDRLHCFDLDMPEDIQPIPHDDEVTGFELWPIRRVAEAVRTSDAFKFNVNLVLIDLFLRLGIVDPASAEGQALRAGLLALDAG